MNPIIERAVKANDKVGIETIQLDPRELDDAIIGTKKVGIKTHLVYSYEMLMVCFMKMDKINSEDAAEHIDFNTIPSIGYMGGPLSAEPKIKFGRRFLI